PLPHLPSFPTRRSSDLAALQGQARVRGRPHDEHAVLRAEVLAEVGVETHELEITPRRSHELEAIHAEHRSHRDLGRAGDLPLGRSEEHTSELQSLAYLV